MQTNKQVVSVKGRIIHGGETRYVITYSDGTYVIANYETVKFFNLFRVGGEV